MGTTQIKNKHSIRFRWYWPLVVYPVPLNTEGTGADTLSLENIAAGLCNNLVFEFVTIFSVCLGFTSICSSITSDYLLRKLLIRYDFWQYAFTRWRIYASHHKLSIFGGSKCHKNGSSMFQQSIRLIRFLIIFFCILS